MSDNPENTNNVEMYFKVINEIPRASMIMIRSTNLVVTNF